MPREPWTWRVVFRVSIGVRIMRKEAALWGGQFYVLGFGKGVGGIPERSEDGFDGRWEIL